MLGATWSCAEPGGDGAAKTFSEQMRAGQLTCPLEVLTQIPDVWDLTADRLDAAFALPQGVAMKKNPYFQWLTLARDRAFFTKNPYSNLQVDLKLFGADLSAEEVVVDFLDGKLNGITFSLFNRGDSGEIDAQEFQRRLKLCGKTMSELLQVRPSERKADAAQGLAAEGWAWTSPRGMALLEYNPEANRGKVEFLRLRIAPRGTRGVFAAAFQGRAMTAKVSELPLNVKKSDGGDVFIKGIPMVDQGQKGYCVVATTQRLFEYYRIPADEHQIAQAAGTDAKSGTNSLAMAEVLGKIDYRFKTHFKIIGMRSNEQLVEVDAHKMTVGKRISEAQFSKEIHRSIDSGVPLLWGLDLGKYPEEPPISKQASGGHMRMIIGYNDQTSHVIFSDSWGAGHEMKRMTLTHAYLATHGLFVMSPTVY